MQELAWASFALLKNANVDGVLVSSGTTVLMGRGEFNEGANLDSNLSAQV